MNIRYKYYLLYINYNSRSIFIANKNWKLLQQLYIHKDYIVICHCYSEIFNEINYDNKFVFEYGKLLSQIGRYEESNSILLHGNKISSDPMFKNLIGKNYTSIGNYIKAEQYYLQSFNQIPNRIYPLYLLTKLYYETKQYEKFYKYATESLQFKPKITSSITEGVKSEIKAMLNNYEIFKKTTKI